MRFVHYVSPKKMLVPTLGQGAVGLVKHKRGKLHIEQFIIHCILIALDGSGLYILL